MKKFFSKAGAYFSSVGDEAKKISWPGGREMFDSSVVVIAFIVILAVTTLVYDTGIRKFIDVTVPSGKADAAQTAGQEAQ